MTKTVFITGAGSGIGATTARFFAEKGWFVGLYDLNEASAKALSDELGEKSCYGAIDVTDRHAVDAAFARFSEVTGGRLDAMINNAGLFQDKPFVDAEPEFLDLMMNVNIGGVVNCARAAYPLLAQTADSHLVNVGSSSSTYGIPNCAVYSASKAFVRNFTEALRAEWAASDILVNVVMPSYVATPMTDGVELTHAGGRPMLSANDIAEAIYAAATTDGMYWIMPRLSRFFETIVKLVPLAWVPAVTRRFLSH